MVALFIGVLKLTAFSQSRTAATLLVFAPTPIGMLVAAYHAIYKMRTRYCLFIALITSLLFGIATAIAYSGGSELAALIDPGDEFLCMELWLITLVGHSFTILIVYGIAYLLEKIYDIDANTGSSFSDKNDI